MTSLGRRGFLGYVGSAAAGAAVGATAIAAAGKDIAAAGKDTPTARTNARVPAADSADAGAAVSPFGPHQPGIAAATPAVIELVALDLLPELHRTHDRDVLARLLRLLSGDIAALCQGRGAPGDPTPWLAAGAAALTVTLGLGNRLMGESWGISSPPGWQVVPPMRHDRLASRWSGGDLVLVVSGRDATTVGHAVRRLVADAAPFATPRWRQQGSWNGFGGDGQPSTGRNLFGQVDGSANPQPGTDLFDSTVWIDGGPWTGGTTLVLRRIRMHMATWDRLTRDQQEKSVGRRLADGAPLEGHSEFDDIVPAALVPDAHARRSHPSLNGGARIFRKGANYEVVDPDGSEMGLLFQSYQADLGRQFVPIQRSLDEVDALNEWTTAVGSAEFAILPGMTEESWLGQQLLET